MEKERVLSIRDLAISFKTSNGIVNAIRGVRLDLFRGETIAIVGESGSGKSVTVKAIMGILSGNGFVNDGSIIFNYTDENGEKVAMIWNKLIQILHHNGCILDSPFMTLSFMALIVIPELKIGERGLFEYSKFKFLAD